MIPLAALFACSLYADDALVVALADNVQQNPLSIVVPSDPSVSESSESETATIEHARTKVRELISRGDSLLIGLLQVPPTWARTFGREPEELLDACVNVSIGTAMLSEFDYGCARIARAAFAAKSPAGGADSRRHCVFERYSNAIGMPEAATVVTLALRYSRPRPTVACDAPILPWTGERSLWGADRVLVGVSTPGAVVQ
jgi:hypothetical protein